MGVAIHGGAGYYPLQVDAISGEALVIKASEQARTWSQQGSWMKSESPVQWRAGLHSINFLMQAVCDVLPTVTILP